MLSQAELHNLFTYKDGNLYWKVLNKKRNIIAGSINNHGYRTVHIGNKLYTAHRIVYMMQHGELPDRLDHIDGNKQNNKIENLRPATRNQNAYNTKPPSTNKSGSKNVHYSITNKAYRVLLVVDGKRKHIGYFKDLELADLVALEARNKYHGKFAHNGLGV
jgi:hypothetical protein